MRGAAVVAIAWLCLTRHAPGLVGGAPEIPTAEAEPEVMLVGSGGNFCTGTAVAPDVVLTAAHCLHAGDTYKLLQFGPANRPILKDTLNIARHPQFDLKAMLAHRATADVALIKLKAPLNVRPATVLPTRPRVAPGEPFTVHGYGVAVRGRGDTAGRLREAALIATGQPGNLQLRLVDPATAAVRAGLGACTGDSGAPTYHKTATGFGIYGVVSWSTGPGGEGGCGGLTGVTPLDLYRGWIERQLAKMRND